MTLEIRDIPRTYDIFALSAFICVPRGNSPKAVRHSSTISGSWRTGKLTELAMKQ